MFYLLLWLLLLLVLALAYIFDVLLGSCVGVYNSEIGYDNNCGEVKRLSHKQFFTELMPFIIFTIGIPLLFCITTF